MRYAFVSGVVVIVGGMVAYLLTSLPTDQLSTPCLPGSYGDRGQNIVAMTPKEWLQPPGLGYLLLDGRFGATHPP